MAKKNETATETVVAEKKPITPVEPENLGSATKHLTPYQPNAIAEFGNSFLIGLVTAAAVEEDAQKALAAAGEAKQFLGFEMLRAVFDLATRHAEGRYPINVHAIFSDTTKDVERLNTNILIHMGVIRKEINDSDEIVTVWSDSNVEALYSYTKELKEKDEAEYVKRHNNRKRLNMRISEACKTAAILLDNKLQPDDLFYSEDENGTLVPTIRNAPKAIAGSEGVVQLGSRKPVKGAELSPTMSSLVKLATDKHKPKAERADKGENREGDAKLGMTDENFGKFINNVRQAINTQEGQFTDEMKKQIKALYDFLKPVVDSF